MSPADRSELVRKWALDAGFERVGMARARPVARTGYVRDWLARGWAGDMDYLRRHHRLREDPARLLPGARSVVVVAHNYNHRPASVQTPGPRGPYSTADQGEPPRGRIAQYAWGRDYHRVLRKKLQRLAGQLHQLGDEPVQTRVCVDTAPIMERELAAAAGIGWIGKNTIIVHAELGSFFLLGEIITTLELEPSTPIPDRCGSCTRCLDACPTGALVAPYQMDARRCISYLTIEHRGDIDRSLRPLMGNWVFGCDVCQDVCPYNRRAPLTSEPAYEPNDRNPLGPRPLLADLINLSEEQYRRYFAGSAMGRATLDMLRRNARIARGNREP